MLVNNNRMTFEKGDQVYYCYGNRSNRYLLINYGFCFADNRYESVEISLKLDVDTTDPFIPEMCYLGSSFQDDTLLKCRLKKDQLNENVLAYFRATLNQNFFKTEAVHALTGRDVTLTRPKNLYYERFVFKFYQALIEFLTSVESNKTSLE